jgi:hypothetical protein
VNPAIRGAACEGARINASLSLKLTRLFTVPPQIVVAMRYVLLSVLTCAALWGVIALTTSGAQTYAVDFEHTASLTFWLLAAVATLITLSLCRFVVFGMPALVGAWCAGNKTWVYAALAGGAIYGVLYLT